MALRAGAIRFNTDSSQMEIYDGNQWTGILATSPELQTGGTRGLWAGGNTPTYFNNIQFVSISTTGNTADFGDLTRAGNQINAVSSRVRAIYGAHYTGSAVSNTMDFVTIASGKLSAISRGAGDLPTPSELRDRSI